MNLLGLPSTSATQSGLLVARMGGHRVLFNGCHQSFNLGWLTCSMSVRCRAFGRRAWPQALSTLWPSARKLKWLMPFDLSSPTVPSTVLGRRYGHVTSWASWVALPPPIPEIFGFSFKACWKEIITRGSPAFLWTAVWGPKADVLVCCATLYDISADRSCSHMRARDSMPKECNRLCCAAVTLRWQLSVSFSPRAKKTNGCNTLDADSKL